MRRLRVGDCFVWKNPRRADKYPLSYIYKEDTTRKVVIRTSEEEIEYGTYDYNHRGGWVVITQREWFEQYIAFVSPENQQP